MVLFQTIGLVDRPLVVQVSGVGGVGALLDRGDEIVSEKRGERIGEA
ncbi:MAG: hypothetical protein WCI50_12560 [Actinomycetes bacterium]